MIHNMISHSVQSFYLIFCNERNNDLKEYATEEIQILLHTSNDFQFSI